MDILSLKNMGREITSWLHEMEPLRLVDLDGKEHWVALPEMHLDRADLDGTREFNFSKPDVPYPPSLRDRFEDLLTTGVGRGTVAVSKRPGFTGSFVNVDVTLTPTQAFLDAIELGCLYEHGEGCELCSVGQSFPRAAGSETTNWFSNIRVGGPPELDKTVRSISDRVQLELTRLKGKYRFSR
jgi:hypothetical protein